MVAGDAHALRRARAAAQLLHRPRAATVAEVVGRLLAVQAQDLRAARLALRARTTGLTAADVDAALTDERSVVVAWLGRGTLHLVGRDDYPWLLGLTGADGAPRSRRRLGQLGVRRGRPSARWRSSSARWPTRARSRAPSSPSAWRRGGSAPRARPRRTCSGSPALRGIAVLGPLRDDGAHAFALTRDWLGAAPDPELEGAERDAALAELARRYLVAHGPATPADLAAWSGLPLRDARAGLAAIAAELVPRDDDLVELAARRARRDPGAAAAGLRPLPPRLEGPRLRRAARGTPSACIPAAGCCARRRRSTGARWAPGARAGGEVALDLFARVDAAARQALREDGQEVARFLQGR